MQRLAFEPAGDLRARVADWLHGETLHGTLWRAGLPKTFDRAAARAATA